MKLKTVKLFKEFKKGMANYSNATAAVTMEWDVEDNEEFDFNAGWDIINRELVTQGDTFQPGFFQSGETKDFYKVTIKSPKIISEGGDKI